MLLADHSLCHPGFSFEILGTDISQRILSAARDAIYPEEHIAPVPPTQRKRYLLRGKNEHTGMVRIAPELRQRVSFRQLNLMDPRFPIPAEINVIFFRNVMIYFDRPTQARVLSSICRHLCTGGHLFISHTESIINSTLPLAQVAPSIFRKLA
jgi:chemotaxis protein methyltransferase CheR